MLKKYLAIFYLFFVPHANAPYLHEEMAIAKSCEETR